MPTPIKRKPHKWKVREGFITLMCLAVFAALVYLFAKWPDKTSDQIMDEYYFFNGPGMSCTAHKSPYTLQCVPRHEGASG